MQHVIRRQRIELRLSKQADAFRVQQQVSKHYNQDVLPLVADVFDELSGENEVLQIGELMIDLGILSEKEINAAHLNDNLLQEIRRQLQEKIRQKGTNVSVKQEPIIVSICKQWLFYMQKGFLPWNNLNIDEAWYDHVLEALAVDFSNVSELKRLIRDNPVVSRRIVQQHDEIFLVKLIEILSTVAQRDLVSMIDVLTKLILSNTFKSRPEPADQQRTLKQKIWEQAIRLAASDRIKSTTEDLFEKALLQYMSYQDIDTIINAGDIPSVNILLPVLKKLFEKPELFPEDRSKDVTRKQKEEEKDAEIRSGQQVDEEGIFVQYAGVVLIHPFLSSLFKKLQFVKEGRFNDKIIQEKAVGLIYYIATGATAPQEYELVVPKIVCEWPLQIPIEKNIVLNEDELNEAENMLQAAVERWTVLKNTSIAGLREGFLQRAGKLFTKNDNLYLQVETNSIDVLLDQLPWNLSLLKLPWMKEILKVEWR
jgi:hypothetical protein